MSRKHEQKADIIARLMAADITTEPHWEAAGGKLQDRDKTVKELAKLADLIIEESYNES